MAKSGNVFDIDRLHQYVEFMKENDITEIDLEQNGEKIRLSRSGGVMPVAASTPGPVAAPTVAADDDEAAEPDHIVTINSPMVGTFYCRPNPESEPYVQVGDMVTAESTVCIVEAMKLMNEIEAETSGVIREVLIENAQPVQFGQALFHIEAE